jgi:glycine C-acetyltransferase
MTNTFIAGITDTLSQIEAEGLYKRERLITSPQSGTVSVAGREVINLCVLWMSRKKT